MSASATSSDRGGVTSPPVAGLLGVLAAIVLLAALAGAAVGGASAPLVLGDPGAVVRWGLAPLKAVTDIVAATLIGGCLLGATVLPEKSPALPRLLRVVSATGGGWVVLASGVLVFSGATLAGLPLTHPNLGAALAEYATTVETGRLALITVLMAALTALLAASVRGPRGLAVTGIAGALTLVPTALSGHAAGPGHEIVSSAWWLHGLGTAVWVGGLISLVLVRPLASSALGDLAGRYSTLAGWAFAVVAFSGVAGALPRLDGPASLLTGYGALLASKTVLLIALGLAGWWHRRHTIGRLAGAHAQRAFWRLVLIEIVGMGLAFGAAAALSVSPPPAQQAQTATPTPAEVVTGLPLPPPLTLGRLFTQVTPDVLWLTIAAALLIGYLRLAWRLHRRGDAWPVGRTISWSLGCLLLVYVTCGGVAVYGRVLFSVHMVEHMTLTMVVPPFLVLGAPITLMLRGLPARTDGSRGPREWLRTILDSRYLAIVANPVFAAANFAFSIVIFYHTDLFGVALRTHLGHELMMIHFLLTGYLFVFSMVGIDPAPTRLPHPFRLLLLFVTMAFHAFFSVALMSQSTLLEATYFSSLGWGFDLLADQKDGAGLAWAIGEIPTVLIALAVAIQWARDDSRRARQRDRAADRDAEKDLKAYNEMLAGFRDRDSQ